MSIATVIHAALGPLVGGRCYPSVFPLRDGVLPTWPAIRYTVISETPSATLCGTGDTGAADDALVQIDIVAATHGAMQTIKAQARSALNALDDPPCSVQGIAELFDDDTRTHRAVMQVEFHPSDN